MHFVFLRIFQTPRESCISKCKYFIFMTFWGATSVVQTRTTIEELIMAAKKKAKKAKKATKKKAAKKKK
jgi:hypothetical protein